MVKRAPKKLAGREKRRWRRTTGRGWPDVAGFLPGAGGAPAAGLPVGTPGADAGKPMDREKVAEQAQRLPLPARIALPVVLANDMHQERIQAELKDEQMESRQPARLPRPKTVPGSGRQTVSAPSSASMA